MKCIYSRVTLWFVFITCNQVLLAQQLPFNPRDYKPIALPSPSVGAGTGYQQDADVMAVRHSLSTGRIDTFYLSGVMSQAGQTESVTGYVPLSLQESEGREVHKIFNNLSPADQVPGFPNYPFSAVVGLFLSVQSPNGSISQGSCSGALIGPRHVISAGHCAFDPSTQSQVSTQSFNPSYAVPSYNLGSSPFGSATITNFWTFTPGWTQNSNWDWDISIFELNQDIGWQTGWFGYGYNNNNWFIDASKVFSSLGYPASNDFGQPVFENGQRMYGMQGYMDWQENGFNHVLCHNNIGFHGQSGSGLYYKDSNNNRYVYGVLSHGNGVNAPYYTCHCMFEQTTVNFLKELIGPVGISEHEQGALLVLYPNPVEGVVNIIVPAEVVKHTASIMVVNNLGQVIYQQRSEALQSAVKIDAGTWLPGVYKVIISTDEKNMSAVVSKL